MTPCIETTNSRGPDGYGRCNAVRFGKRVYGTHIVAWADANGRLPGPGMKILHSCDNPPCINPEHLREGTQQENVADMIARGRHKGQKKTCCPKCGGAYSVRSCGRRRCDPCKAAYDTEYRARAS